MSTEAPCSERVGPEWEKEKETLTALLALNREDPDAYHDEYGNLYEYGLSFDYVEPGTFNDQPEGFFRYQISWGGPSDEIRFFVNLNGSVHRAEYWFMDWFDGAKVDVSGEEVVADLWEWLEPSWYSKLEEVRDR